MGSSPTGTVSLTHQQIVDTFHYLYYHTMGWDSNTYLGYQIKQCPFDLQAYQELVFRVRPEFTLQTGVAGGGSILYFATLLDLIGAPPESIVIGVDVELTEAARTLDHARIHLLEGDSTSMDITSQISDLVSDRTGMVVLDSDHRMGHVLDELRLYCQWVAHDGYLVVEDTNINGHPAYPNFGPGPLEAVEQFLQENSNFTRDDSPWKRNLLSFHQKGWLKRVSAQ